MDTTEHADGLDLGNLEALEKDATPGKWTPELRDGKFLVRAIYRTALGRVTAWPAMCECGAQPNGANAAFIAALRNAAPALFESARALAAANARIAELEAQIDELCDRTPAPLATNPAR